MVASYDPGCALLHKENSCRPSATRSLLQIIPGTDVPGYLMPPASTSSAQALRGWNLMVRSISSN